MLLSAFLEAPFIVLNLEALKTLRFQPFLISLRGWFNKIIPSHDCLFLYFFLACLFLRIVILIADGVFIDKLFDRFLIPALFLHAELLLVEGFSGDVGPDHLMRLLMYLLAVGDALADHLIVLGLQLEVDVDVDVIQCALRFLLLLHPA